MPADDDMLSLADVARLVFPSGGVTAGTLKRRIRQGKLRAYRVGKSYCTTLADVRAMIEACAVSQRAEAMPPRDSDDRAATSRMALAQELEKLQAKVKR